MNPSFSAKSRMNSAFMRLFYFEWRRMALKKIKWLAITLSITLAITLYYTL